MKRRIQQVAPAAVVAAVVDSVPVQMAEGAIIIYEQARPYLHLNYAGIFLHSTGIGLSIVQAFCYLTGLEVAETLAIATEHVLTTGETEIVETTSTAHAYLRSVTYVSWWVANVVV